MTCFLLQIKFESGSDVDVVKQFYQLLREQKNYFKICVIHSTYHQCLAGLGCKPMDSCLVHQKFYHCHRHNHRHRLIVEQNTTV